MCYNAACQGKLILRGDVDPYQLEEMADYAFPDCELMYTYLSGTKMMIEFGGPIEYYCDAVYDFHEAIEPHMRSGLILFLGEGMEIWANKYDWRRKAWMEYEAVYRPKDKGMTLVEKRKESRQQYELDDFDRLNEMEKEQ